MSEKVRYTLFALFLFLTQILGTGIVPMGLFRIMQWSEVLEYSLLGTVLFPLHPSHGC